MALAQPDEIGVDRPRAVLKARFMSQFAAEVMRKESPEVAEKMFMHTCVLNWGTRALGAI